MLLGDSLLFTDAYLALQFVDSGMRAQTRTEWANNINDLMTDIGNRVKKKREKTSMFSELRNKGEECS